jgi:hypothetical protein
VTARGQALGHGGAEKAGADDDVVRGHG